MVLTTAFAVPNCRYVTEYPAANNANLSDLVEFVAGGGDMVLAWAGDSRKRGDAAVCRTKLRSIRRQSSISFESQQQDLDKIHYYETHKGREHFP